MGNRNSLFSKYIRLKLHLNLSEAIWSFFKSCIGIFEIYSTKACGITRRCILFICNKKEEKNWPDVNILPFYGKQCSIQVHGCWSKLVEFKNTHLKTNIYSCLSWDLLIASRYQTRLTGPDHGWSWLITGQCCQALKQLGMVLLLKLIIKYKKAPKQAIQNIEIDNKRKLKKTEYMRYMIYKVQTYKTENTKNTETAKCWQYKVKKILNCCRFVPNDAVSKVFKI